MLTSMIYLLVLSISCSQGKVADKKLLNDIIPNTEHEKHNDVTKIDSSNIELPTVRAIMTESTTVVTETKKNHFGSLENEDLEPNNKCGNSSEIIDNSIDPSPDNCSHEVKIDNGTALILTQLIEEGRLEEARNACRVNQELFLGLDSYSGFLTVNETYGSNSFFWFFPVQGKPVNETPWILWLQGGPGASSMMGLFLEIGPFSFAVDGNLIPNEHTWLRDHSLLFIDNPVGAGYSYTQHENGFARDKGTYSTHLYSALRQFLQIFPEMRVPPLYIAGESYAGKFVPALAAKVHQQRTAPGGDVNLQGIMVGNAFVDPTVLIDTLRPYLSLGLLAPEQEEFLQPMVDKLRRNIADKQSTAAKNAWMQLIYTVLSIAKLSQAYNFLKRDYPITNYLEFLSRSEVKRAIHVGDILFTPVNITANTEIADDFLSDASPLYEELLEYYRVLIYCGNLDLMLPCESAAVVHRKWKWSKSQEFLQANRYPFLYNKRTAGYYKMGGGLTEVVIMGAGHMAPVDTPAESHYLISRFTKHKHPVLSTNNLIHDNTFLREFAKNRSIFKLP